MSDYDAEAEARLWAIADRVYADLGYVAPEDVQMWKTKILEGLFAAHTAGVREGRGDAERARELFDNASAACLWYQARASGGMHVAKTPGMAWHTAKEVVKALAPLFTSALPIDDEVSDG